MGIWAGIRAQGGGLSNRLIQARGVGIANPQGIETNFFQRLDNDASKVITPSLWPAATKRRVKNRKLWGCLCSRSCPKPVVDRAWRGLHKAHRSELNLPTRRMPRQTWGFRPACDCSTIFSRQDPYWMQDRTREILIDVMTDPQKVRPPAADGWIYREVKGSPVDLVLGDRPLIRHNELMGDRCVLVGGPQSFSTPARAQSSSSCALPPPTPQAPIRTPWRKIGTAPWP